LADIVAKFFDEWPITPNWAIIDPEGTGFFVLQQYRHIVTSTQRSAMSGIGRS
jgi:hypothetical protein